MSYTPDMKCVNCGKGNRLNARFCDSCGTKLIADQGDAVSELFVGRENELKTIVQAVEDSLSGRGRIIALSGEAGIGKTCTANIAEEIASAKGIKTFSGYCHEYAGAPPYWPWIQLLREWVESSSEEALRALPKDTLSIISGLLPELNTILKEPPPPIEVQSDDIARFKLFDALTSLWKKSSTDSPIMLVIDDLHWADISSLKMLEFFSREISRSPILLMVTFRESEISRTHPLSDILAEISRSVGYHRIDLTGLSLVEASQYFAIVTGELLPSAKVNHIYDRTEGNPLFLSEMARYFQREDIRAGVGHQALNSDSFPLPQGIQEVIGRRLNQISVDSNTMLKLASVIGNRFNLSLLNALCRKEPVLNNLEGLLDEALNCHVLTMTNEPQQYQFSHALIRDTLYGEISLSQRNALHNQIADYLEGQCRGEEDDRLIPLAHHYAASLPNGDKDKTLHYSELAGRQSDKMLAFEEAANFYQTALDLISPSPANRRFTLFLRQGESLLNAGESLKSMQAFRNALDIASALECFPEVARAAILFEEASWRTGMPGKVAVNLLRHAYNLLDDQNSLLQVSVLSSLTRALIFTGDLEASHIVNFKAEKMARELGDESSLVFVLLSGMAARWGPERLTSRLTAAREAIGLAKELGEKKRLVDLAGWYMFDLMEAGDTSEAKKMYELQEQLARQLHQPYWIYVGRIFQATYALFHGRLHESETLAVQAMDMGGQLTGQDVAGVFGLQIFNVRREQGRLKEIETVVTEFLSNTSMEQTWKPGLAVLYAELDKYELAQKEFGEMSADNFAAIPRDALWPGCITYLAEVCVYLQDRGAAAALRNFLLPHDGYNIVVGAFTACHGAAARLIGMLEALMELWDEAERHFNSAIEMNDRQGAKPWLAHSQYEYARMLLKRDAEGDRNKASQMLLSSQMIASELGMQNLDQRIKQCLSESTDGLNREQDTFGLTKREIEVLSLVAEGMSNKAIARHLYRSENTIANHIRHILEKTHCSNRAEAVAFALKRELVDE